MSKKDREIGNLKDECADAHESSTCAKKARKNAPSMMMELQDKVKAMEREMAKIKKEKEDPKIKIVFKRKDWSA